MSEGTRDLIVTSLAVGAVVFALATAAALGGAGMTAFWVAIALGAPVSMLVEHAVARLRGHRGPFDVDWPPPGRVRR